MDFIPHIDSEFDQFVDIFCPYVHTNKLALGISDELDTSLQASCTNWKHDYPAQLAAITTEQEKTQVKKNTYKVFVALIREVARIVQANKAVTNDMKAAMKITVPKETHTPAAKPTTRPMAEIDNKMRLQHTINFFDEATPTSKAKPKGVRGCEIREKIGGAPPVDESELSFVAEDSKTPYVNTFNGADAGKIVHYMLRWVSTRGEYGPWSETISVTISA